MTIFALLGFNPDKTHHASLLQQLCDQLILVQPDSIKYKLLEKAKHTLPFPDIVPPFQLQVLWITAKAKKYSTKTYFIVCNIAHANFLRSFIVCSYHERHILGLGKVFTLAIRNNDPLSATITWNDKLIDRSSILNLINISKSAMDQPFQ